MVLWVNTHRSQKKKLKYLPNNNFFNVMNKYITFIIIII